MWVCFKLILYKLRNSEIVLKTLDLADILWRNPKLLVFNLNYNDLYETSSQAACDLEISDFQRMVIKHELYLKKLQIQFAGY